MLVMIIIVKKETWDTSFCPSHIPWLNHPLFWHYSCTTYSMLLFNVGLHFFQTSFSLWRIYLTKKGSLHVLKISSTNPSPDRTLFTGQSALPRDQLQSDTWKVFTEFSPFFTLSSPCLHLVFTLSSPCLRWLNWKNAGTITSLGETIFAERCLKKRIFPTFLRATAKRFMPFMLNNAHEQWTWGSEHQLCGRTHLFKSPAL